VGIKNCLLTEIVRIAILVVLGIPAVHALPDEPIPILERTINITFERERLESALRKISSQAGFTFSYNSDIVNGNRVISENFQGKTVREVLDEIFAGSIQYKARGKYIILTKASPPEKKEHTITGYIKDERGKRLQNVSVYDPVSLSSTVTDSFGYFQLEVDQPSGEEIQLAIRKQNYTDTVVAVTTSRQRLINIEIREHAEKVNVIADSVRQKLKRFWETKVMTKQSANLLNIQDTLYRKFQFSVVPFVGTNHKLSGSVINDYSLNLYGGYALGVRKLEFGGIFNIIRGDMEGTQIGGIFNAVAGRTNGWQLAGTFNMNRDSVNAPQLAGMFNLNGNSSNNFAMAGMLNLV
jgi:hypothetical protein